jgi:hypothetical protein
VAAALRTGAMPSEFHSASQRHNASSAVLNAARCRSCRTARNTSTAVTTAASAATLAASAASAAKSTLPSRVLQRTRSAYHARLRCGKRVGTPGCLLLLQDGNGDNYATGRAPQRAHAAGKGR